jgi:membrane-associated phospholipid phosphatase
MIDPIPYHGNRIAYWLGQIFHPYLICVPTLAAVLADQPLIAALGWLLLVVVILLPPLMVMGLWLKRRERYLYQRRSRTPMYLTFWISLLVCLMALVALQAPLTLIACIVALALWLPLQLVINTYVTKVSTHAAVVAACMMGLFLLGRLSHPLLLAVALAAVLLTLWARVMTRNHTPVQVIMGTLTGITPVLVVFPIVLRGL